MIISFLSPGDHLDFAAGLDDPVLAAQSAARRDDQTVAAGGRQLRELTDDFDEIRGRHRRLRDALARLQGNERNAFAPDAAANAS